MSGRRKGKAPLPGKAEILAFIRGSPTPVGKREVARAFQIAGPDRIALKAIMKDLAQEGEIGHPRRRPTQAPGRLPDMAVVEVTGIDSDGEVLARPVIWTAERPPPPIYLASDRLGTPALAKGDRVLASLRRGREGAYEAKVIRRVAGEPKRVIGLLEPGGRLRPTDRRVKADYRVAEHDRGDALVGELVLADVLHTHRLGALQARVVERLGPLDSPRAISLISLHEHDIPVEFGAEALAQAGAAQPVALGARTDLRALPLVTIDGADARDFDDAVWAGADDDAANAGGFKIVVAIADVAWYVRPGDALDREAYRRGNSVYFPDRAVPMLPEKLSNDLCSLRPGEDRACLAVEMRIDREGRKRHHSFVRGLMRSAARLTYDQTQTARDGQPDDTTGPLLEPVIAPLYRAFDALLGARLKRGTLDLDIPERQVILDDAGKVAAIRPRQRWDSHRLIEEFMIAANVAAAEELEARRQPCLYRVHDAPDPVKIEALREFLETLDLRLARGQVMRPVLFARLLEKAAGTPHAAMVNELVLRSQSQAVYSPRNIGHFGLALTRYCHFTSPIRRYADLLVHRALVAGLAVDDGSLPRDAVAQFVDIGEHVSATERRAAAAERAAVDRFAASYLAARVGKIERGRVTGVTRFGLFVRLADSGADGLVPISTLGDDYYEHDERRHVLVGRRWGTRFALGEPVWVLIVDVAPLTGGIVLRLVDSEDAKAKTPAAAVEKPKTRPHRAGPERHGPAGRGRKGRRRG